VDKGCRKNCFYDGMKQWKCGDKHYDGQRHYCDACKLKIMGVVVGAKFYKIDYCWNTRFLNEYKILKLNEASVRVKYTFLDGRQPFQEFSIRNEKALETFDKCAKTFGGAVASAIRANKRGIENKRLMARHIPKEIAGCKKEIKELKRLTLKSLKSGAKKK